MTAITSISDNYWNVNFDGLTLLTTLVLYSQSYYLNHSNRILIGLLQRTLWAYRARWPHCCSLLKESLFWKLKVMRREFNGFFIIKQIEKPDCALFCCEALRKRFKHSRSGEKHPSRYVSPHTSFVLQPPPACLTTGQSTVKASLFVNHSGFWTA